MPRVVPKNVPAVPRDAVARAVAGALAEDVGSDAGAADLSTMAVIPADRRARATIVAREDCVLAGLPCAREVFEHLDPKARFEEVHPDGERVAPGDVVLRIEALARAILTGERVALNFVQRLSGIATATRAHVEAAGSGVRVLDTRKTTPGLRALERWAVAVGGGANHRFGLFDQVLLKENHLALSGLPVRETVARARKFVGPEVVLGAEARTEAEARAAIEGGADYVLLDNFAPAELARVVASLRGAIAKSGRAVELEASGGVRAANIALFAGSGVDRISCGSLTHSARAIDFALDVEPVA